MAKFKYRGSERSSEDVSRRAKQTGGGYDSYLLPDIPFFKPKEGENQVRILPPTWEDVAKWGTNWEIQVHMHRNVGPDEGTYLCLDKMLGQPCPVCDARRQAADEEERDALRPQWRALAWIIDRDDEKAGPQVWGLPLTLFREINLRSMDKKTGAVVLIDDPENGYDLFFTKEGTGKKTKYISVEIDRDPTPIHDNEKRQDQWLEYLAENALPDVLNYFEPDHIEQVLFGRGGSDDGERGGGRASRRGGRGGGRGDAPREEEDTGRGSRRGRSQPEEAPSGRRRGGDEPEEVEERGGRRGRAEPEPERSGRRGRAEPEEPAAEERPTGRRGRTDPEPEPEPEGRTGRRGRAAAEPEEPATRGPRRDDPEEVDLKDGEEDPPPPRRGGRRTEPEPEPAGRRGRGAGRSGGEEPAEDPEPQARRQLSSLRGRANR